MFRWEIIQFCYQAGWLAVLYYEYAQISEDIKLCSWTLEAVGNDHFHMNYSDCIVLTRHQANLFLIDIEYVLTVRAHLTQLL